MGWKAFGMGRIFEGEDADMELEKAYKEGYRDAMEEVHGGRYGERREDERMYDDYPRMYDGDDYGERRGVKGTGRYSRMRRR